MNEGMRDGIIFDLDGTLLDSMWVWDDVDREFLGNRGLEVPADYQKEIVALGFEETAHYTIERFHLDEDPADIMNEWRHMAEEKYAWDVDVKPMVIPMLAWFKDHDMKLGIATSSYESLFMPCLERNQILQYFDAIAKRYHFKLSDPIKDIPKEGMDAILYGTKGEPLQLRYEKSEGFGVIRREFEGIINNLER